ncbi:MAG: flagellar hook-basal body complex protein FliE, partial [Betaproteobacteria bacterium]|nr:flagellar hook-basal body complex protein FliE [Betaproteobacteria bacterium]
RASEVQQRLDGMMAGSSVSAADRLRGISLGAIDGSSDQYGSGGRLDFQAVLKEAVRGVSDAQNTAQTKAQAYQLGDDKVSLEDVMISLQKANLAMQGMVQVRNRLVEAYREVMNMQV